MSGENEALKPCRSYMRERSFCRDGFMQWSNTCWGAPNGNIPMCCKEDDCAHHFAQTGGKPPDHLIVAALPTDTKGGGT